MASTKIDTGYAIRAGLAEKAEAGNTSFIHEQDVLKYGGNKNQWRKYDDTLVKMETYARQYVFYYYSVLQGTDGAALDEAAVKRDEELQRINNELISLKKELLGWIDPEQKHRCAYCDGIVIGEMAHDVIAQKNNTEGTKGFKSRSAHTYAARRKFRHALEAYMGILITGADVVEPERAHYLRSEKTLLGKIRSAEKHKQELTDQRATFVSFAAEFQLSEDQQKVRLHTYDQQIEQAEKDIEEAKKALASFHIAHPGKKAIEPTIQEEMGEARKEEKMSATLEKVEAMDDAKKAEVMKVLKINKRKSEKVESLNKRIAEALFKLSEASESESQAEPEQAEPQVAEAAAK